MFSSSCTVFLVLAVASGEIGRFTERSLDIGFSYSCIGKYPPLNIVCKYLIVKHEFI
jgi:hypothetical protein